MKRVLAYVIIFVLNLADIVTTEILLRIAKSYNFTEHPSAIEVNFIMRYVMGVNDWLWIIVKLGIIFAILAIMHKYAHKISTNVIIVVILLLAFTVISNIITILSYYQGGM
jgi:signal transduction histidine kinase